VSCGENVTLLLRAGKRGKSNRLRLGRRSRPITYRIVKILILAFVAVIAYPYIPAPNPRLSKAFPSFWASCFLWASSSAIANLIAGVSLTYMASFRVGDVIKVGDSTGVVLERRLYITRLKTFKNQVITSPMASSSPATSPPQPGGQAGERPDSPYQRHHRLRRPLGESPRSPHRGGKPNRTYPQESRRPSCCRPRSTEFLRGLRGERLYDAPKSCPGSTANCTKYPEYLQRRRVEIMSPHYTQIRDGNHTTIPAGLPAAGL